MNSYNEFKIATNQLRFASEQKYIGCGDWERQVRLQQLWKSEPDANGDVYGEWRDVPTVKI